MTRLKPKEDHPVRVEAAALVIRNKTGADIVQARVIAYAALTAADSVDETVNIHRMSRHRIDGLTATAYAKGHRAGAAR